MKTKFEGKSDVKATILHVSEKLFAENGFDGTGIALIAEHAGITKSLLYYYFDSKEKILEELFSKYLQSVVKEKEDIFASELSDEDRIRCSMQAGFRLLKSNKNLIRIMLTEALKGNIDRQLIQEILEPFMLKGNSDSRKSIDMIGGSQDFSMYAFFFGIGPIIMLMYFGEPWMKVGNQSVDEFVDQFIAHMIYVFTNDITGVKRNFFEPYINEINDNLKKII